MACLYLVPNTLDLGCAEVPLQDVLPLGVIRRAAGLAHWVAEDAKSARAFLKRVHAVEPLCLPLQEMDIRVLPPPAKGGQGAAPGVGSAAEQADRAAHLLLQPLAEGHDMGLVSEAGLPAVADPGSAVVAQAHRMGATVMPMSGPNSMVMALSASGLQGQSFAFVGYLPQDRDARAARLRELQAHSRAQSQTQLLMETPYRNAAMMAALVEHLHPSTRLSVACGLTLPTGWCRTRTVAQWRQALPEFEKGLPAVFAFQSSAEAPRPGHLARR